MRVNDAYCIIKKFVKIPDMPGLMLWGPPGIGKSGIVKQLAGDLGIGFIDLRLILLSPIDLKGMPALDRENQKAVWYMPDFLPYEERDGKKGVLFLDELPNSPPAVQSAALQLVLDRALGSYRLPAGWSIIAAGNRGVDRAGTYALNSSLANRFVHLSLACDLPPMEMPAQDIQADVEDWKIWAYKNDIHPYIISFLNFRPNLLWQATSQVAYATPRSWEMVHKIIIAYKGKVKEAYHCIAGAVGSGPAAEFAGFVEVVDELPDVSQIVKGKSVCVPDKPDTVYAVIGALINHLTRNPQNGRVAGAVSWIQGLPPEFQVVFFQDLLKTKLRRQVASSPEFAAWAKENRDVFLEI